MTSPSHSRQSIDRNPKAALLCRSITAAVILVAFAAATSYAKSVPVPREKPTLPSENPKSADPAGDALSSQCLRALSETRVVADVAAGFASRGRCTMEDAVAMEAVETRIGTMTLPGRPTLDCQFAAILGAWLGEVVNPIAGSLLGSSVEAVVTGPGHQCRSRSSGKLSEHAIGNAIDIPAVRLADGRIIAVERWAEAEGAEREFLRAVSASACGYFTTVLGPGSDAAHADHLHLDHAERRTAEYRICMPR